MITPDKTDNRNRYYVLACLTAVYFFYQLDRNAIYVTQELIRREFSLTDTQLGLISGLLYGVAYAIFGLPLGRAVDSVNRAKLLSFLVGTWSVATAICSLATSSVHLAIARFVVGGAEAGGAPASLSLLADKFPPERRATVSSIFFAGAGLGSFVSFLIGSQIAAQYGWRMVFLFYGLPGILLALLLFFTIRDPRRVKTAEEKAAQVTFGQALRTILADRAVLSIYIGSALYTFASAGTVAWMVSFLMRSHDFPIQHAGAAAALTLGLIGPIVSIPFGFLTDRAEKKRAGGLLQLIAVAAFITCTATMLMVYVDNPVAVMIFVAFWGAGALVFIGPSNAAIAHMTPPQMRGVAFALLSVLGNLVGSGLGPLVIGMGSDWFAPSLGDNSIRAAIGIAALAYIVAGACFIYAASTYRRRMANRPAGDNNLAQATSAG